MSVASHIDEIKEGAFSITVEYSDHGKRLDFFLSEKLNNFTRSYLSELIRNNHIFVNQQYKKSSYKVKNGDLVSGRIPESEEISFEPEFIDLNVLYEDNEIIVINKQAGLVVHPAPGNWSGTLVNGLLYHCPGIKETGTDFRPGIVHRLDKNTSGVMVVAKTRMAHMLLSEAFKDRKVYKEYRALVSGATATQKGVIKLPVGRHPVDRKKMATVSPSGRPAETHWCVVKRLRGATLLNVNIKTGRTHQIRVHCKSMGHPIIGDETYGSVNKDCLKRHGEEFRRIVQSVNRQMLHSFKLEFTHPVNHQPLVFSAPLPEDMTALIYELEDLI